MKQASELKWVTAARVVGGYCLELTFNDGYCCVFDCESLISKYKIFAPLRDKNVFSHFSLDGWTVTWLDGSIDIAPEYFYENGVAAENTTDYSSRFKALNKFESKKEFTI